MVSAVAFIYVILMKCSGLSLCDAGILTANPFFCPHLLTCLAGVEKQTRPMTTTPVCALLMAASPWSKYGNVKIVFVWLGNNSVFLLLVSVNLLLVLGHTRSSVVTTQLHILSFLFFFRSWLLILLHIKQMIQ